METFNAQFTEYMTSVDNYASHGIDRNLPWKMKSFHTKIDSLMETIDKTKKSAEEFYNNY